MATYTQTYTFTGSEAHPSSLFAQFFPAFTGTFTVDMVLSAPAPGMVPLGLNFAKPSGGCFSFASPFNSGESSHHYNLEVSNSSTGMGTWTCTDWQWWSMGIASGGVNPAAGTTLTVTIVNTAVVVPCEYGVSKNEPTAAIAETGIGLLTSIEIFRKNPWAWPSILVSGAGHIALDTLCSGPPLDPVTIDVADWTTPSPGQNISVAIRKIGQNFQNELWHFFCH